MDSKFLENMGLIFVRINNNNEIEAIQKDSLFNFPDFNNVDELINIGMWQREYKRAKRGDNQVARPVKIGKKWISFEIYPDIDSQKINIKIENVSKIQSERLIILRDIVRDGSRLGKDLGTVIFGAMITFGAVQGFYRYEHEESLAKDKKIISLVEKAFEKSENSSKVSDSLAVLNSEIMLENTATIKRVSEQTHVILNLTNELTYCRNEQIDCNLELRFWKSYANLDADSLGLKFYEYLPHFAHKRDSMRQITKKRHDEITRKIIRANKRKEF